MQSILPRTIPLQVGEAIRCATDYLLQHDLVYGHGTGEAVDDAAWLILESVGASPIELPDYQLVMNSSALELCETWLRKRALDRIPAAYLVGRSWFAGLEIKVDQRALIPRSPISELILNGFHGLLDTQSAFTVLDLCTGGGCIALAIAELYPESAVIATDLSAEALSLAEENVELHQLQSRVQLIQGDLFAPLFSNFKQHFDLIVANPPYVDRDDIDAMGLEFHCEPEMGLASGQDGLDITRRILADSARYLKPDGVLIVEVGNSSEALVQAFPNLPFLWFDFTAGGDGVFALSCSELSSA